VANFPPFAKAIFKKEYSATNSLKNTIRQNKLKNHQKLPQLLTT
jgi:hypothetical protein